MLEAVRLKETWLFQKARLLAIFDDVDTILLIHLVIVGPIELRVVQLERVSARWR